MGPFQEGHDADLGGFDRRVDGGASTTAMTGIVSPADDHSLSKVTPTVLGNQTSSNLVIAVPEYGKVARLSSIFSQVDPTPVPHH
jgi:hypothetical protein